MGLSAFSGIRLALITIILASCSPSWHIRQALRKDPGMMVRDTVVRSDTLIRTVQRVDTVLRVRPDTTYIITNRDSVIVRFAYRHDTVRLQAECPPAEMITTTQTITETIEVEPAWVNKLKWLLIALFGSLLIGLILFLARRKRR